MNTKQNAYQTKRQALRAEWAKTINDYESSGMSKASFCREHGLPVWKLHYWCKALQEQDKFKGGFIELSPGVMATGSGVWVSCGRYRVHVDTRFDSKVLRQVIEALT